MQDHKNGALPSHEQGSADAGRLDGLADLASGRTPVGINRMMALARETLGMDVAFVSRFAEDRMLFRNLEGDGGRGRWTTARRS